jgi:hypothetical protein
MNGRSLAPAAEIVRFGDDKVFVSAATAKMFDEQVGGLNRSMQSIRSEWQSLMQNFEASMTDVRNKANNAVTDATAAVQKQAQDANLGERLEEGEQAIRKKTTNLRGQLTTVLAERVVEQAKGHRAQHSVLTDDHEFVVIAGQVVTDDVIDSAREHRKELALINSVGLDIEDVVNGESHSLQKTLEGHAAEWEKEGKAVIDSLRETAINLADEFKTRLENTRK